MNSRRWWLVIALVLSVGANVGLLIGRGWRDAPVETPADAMAPDARTADAAPETAPRIPSRYRRLIGRMADELRLDAEQRPVFVANHERFFRQTRLGREQIARVHAALRAELLAATPDRDRAEQLVDELARAQGDLERAFVATFFDTIVLLDAEQGLRYRRILGHLRRLQSLRDRPDGERPRPPWRRPGPPAEPPADAPAEPGEAADG